VVFIGIIPQSVCFRAAFSTAIAAIVRRRAPPAIAARVHRLCRERLADNADYVLGDKELADAEARGRKLLSPRTLK